MFSIIVGLSVLDRISPLKAEAVARWFDPASLWIQRWLGAFYVPSLAMLPLTITGIPGDWFHSFCCDLLHTQHELCQLVIQGCEASPDMQNIQQRCMLLTLGWMDWAGLGWAGLGWALVLTLCKVLQVFCTNFSATPFTQMVEVFAGGTSPQSF